MAKLPRYLRKTEISYHPTEYDKVGCDGMYIKKLHVAWWYTPILYFIAVVAVFRDRVWEHLKRKYT